MCVCVCVCVCVCARVFIITLMCSYMYWSVTYHLFVLDN